MKMVHQKQKLGLLDSITALAHLCAKYTRRLVRARLGNKPSRHDRFLAASHGKSSRRRKSELGEESFGDGGVWRRSILMGDKCQPLDFSGVIYYDCDGRRVADPPMKSPRASPYVGY